MIILNYFGHVCFCFYSDQCWVRFFWRRVGKKRGNKTEEGDYGYLMNFLT